MDVSQNPIRSMEPRIIERLRLVFPESSFVIERIPSVFSLEEFDRLTRQAPFIGLAWVGMDNDRNAGRNLQGVWKWRLVMICKATGNLERRLKGDSRDIGLDDMIDVALVMLNGVSFKGIGTATVTAAQSIYSEGWGDKAIVLAHIDFEIRTTMFTGALELETLEDFAGINATWLLENEIEEGKDNGRHDQSQAG